MAVVTLEPTDTLGYAHKADESFSVSSVVFVVVHFETNPSLVHLAALQKPVRSPAGGSATAGGINFQASVTALALAHLASGAKLGWCDGLCDDMPVAVLAETAGAGESPPVL
jgi:hypothetical protein